MHSGEWTIDGYPMGELRYLSGNPEFIVFYASVKLQLVDNTECRNGAERFIGYRVILSIQGIVFFLFFFFFAADR